MDPPANYEFNDILSRLAFLESRWTVSPPRTISVHDKDYSSVAEAILQVPERRLTQRECLYLFGDDRLIGTRNEVLFFVPRAFYCACESPENTLYVGPLLVAYYSCERTVLEHRGLAELFREFFVAMFDSLVYRFELVSSNHENGKLDVEVINSSEAQAVLDLFADPERHNVTAEIISRLAKKQDSPVASAWFLEIGVFVLDRVTSGWSVFDDRVSGMYFDSELVDYHFAAACRHWHDDSLAKSYFEQLRGVLVGW